MKKIVGEEHKYSDKIMIQLGIVVYWALVCDKILLDTDGIFFDT